MLTGHKIYFGIPIATHSLSISLSHSLSLCTPGCTLKRTRTLNLYAFNTHTQTLTLNLQEQTLNRQAQTLNLQAQTLNLQAQTLNLCISFSQTGCKDYLVKLAIHFADYLVKISLYFHVVDTPFSVQIISPSPNIRYTLSLK